MIRTLSPFTPTPKGLKRTRCSCRWSACRVEFRARPELLGGGGHYLLNDDQYEIGFSDLSAAIAH